MFGSGLLLTSEYCVIVENCRSCLLFKAGFIFDYLIPILNIKLESLHSGVLSVVIKMALDCYRSYTLSSRVPTGESQYCVLFIPVLKGDVGLL